MLTSIRCRCAIAVGAAAFLGIHAPQARAAMAAFEFTPLGVPILNARFVVNTAALTAHHFAGPLELNYVRLTNPAGPEVADLSNALFGNTAIGGAATVNQGPLGTGLLSAALPAGFITSVLSTGRVGLSALFTDTADALFAIDAIYLEIETEASVTQILFMNGGFAGGTLNGFGIGLGTGANLPNVLPNAIPFQATNTGFDETIHSKNINVIPSPWAALPLLGAGAFSLRRRRSTTNDATRRGVGLVPMVAAVALTLSAVPAYADDCNANSVDDQIDIAQGDSDDCNANDIPDECELSGNDDNGNFIPDDCEGVTFRRGHVLIAFKPGVTAGQISLLAANCGCSIAQIVPIAEEDLNNNGFLDFGEDENGNGILDQFVIHVMRLKSRGGGPDAEELALNCFTSNISDIVEAGSLNWDSNDRATTRSPNDPLYPSQYGLDNRGIAPLSISFVDANADTFYTDAEPIYFDANADSAVDANDTPITGMAANGTALRPIPLTHVFRDANNNGRYDNGEPIYFPQENGPGSAGFYFINPGDLRLTTIGALGPGVVGAADADFRAAAGGPRPIRQRLLTSFAGVGIIDADIDAPQGWAHGTGSRTVVVGVLDSGLDSGHPDIFGEDANGNGRLDGGEDANGNGVLDTNTFVNTAEVNGMPGVDDDLNGVDDDFVGASFITTGAGVLQRDNIFQDNAGSSHGTHVAGIIGAIGDNGIGVAGVNWNVRILPMRTDHSFLGRLAAVRYMVAMRRAGVNIRTVNFSSGDSPFDLNSRRRNQFPMRPDRIHASLMQMRKMWTVALRLLDAKDIMLVCAAGYDGVNVDTTSPEDFNGNGALDISEDANRNGALNPGEDANGNGRLDYGEDIDVSGGLAAVGADVLGNGVLDPGEDVNPGGMGACAMADGRLDLREDRNGNGMLDAGEDFDGDGCLDVAEDLPDTVNDVFLDIPVVLNNPCLLTVTWTNNTDRFHGNANWGGTSVDVAAPGAAVYSTIRQVNGSYGTLGGTSMATPHVAGIAAHLLSLPAFEFSSRAQVKDRIMTGLNAPAGVPHPHGVDPRVGMSANPVVAGKNKDGRARITCGDDFGDLQDFGTGVSPIGYPFDVFYRTLLGRTGPRHEDIGEEWLGRATDIPAGVINMLSPPAPPIGFIPLGGFVSPEFDALTYFIIGGDADGISNLDLDIVGEDFYLDPDKDVHDDGVVVFGPIVSGGDVRVRVVVRTRNGKSGDASGTTGRYAGGHANDGVNNGADDKFIWVNGFFDWNANGEFENAEHMFDLRVDPSQWRGANLASGGVFDVVIKAPVAPPNGFPSKIGTRFRLDYSENLGQSMNVLNFVTPVGPSPGGTVRIQSAATPLPIFGGAGMPIAQRYDSLAIADPNALKLSNGVAQYGEVEDHYLDARTPDQLHLDLQGNNQYPSGSVFSFDAVVESGFQPMASQILDCKRIYGPFVFNNGAVSGGGTMATHVTSANGRATIQITVTGESAGQALVEVRLRGTNLVTYYVFNVIPGQNGGPWRGDLAGLLGNFGKSIDPGTGPDLNGDGVIDTTDLLKFIRNPPAIQN